MNTATAAAIPATIRARGPVPMPRANPSILKLKTTTFMTPNSVVNTPLRALNPKANLTILDTIEPKNKNLAKVKIKDIALAIANRGATTAKICWNNAFPVKSLAKSAKPLRVSKKL